MSQLYSTLPPQPHPQDASVSQMQEYSATEVPTLGSNAQSDPAALLRQAALSSRKLKRRKLDTTALPAPIPSSLARPVAPTSSIVLDYGQEESSSATPTSESVPSAPAMTSSSSSSSAHMPPPSIVQMNSIIGSALAAIPDDDASAREEGEISEGEETPSPTFRRSIPPPIANTTFIAPVEVTTPAHSSFTPLSRSPSVLTEEAYQRAVTPASTATSARRHSTTAVTTPKTPAALDSARLETPLYVLDEDHVRPGLTITQKEYDKVKEIVLDLLGYGVTPEYLVDCGLSREIIFYVFTELNLRLPSNLDTSGIPPYPPPPDVIASILASHFNPAYSSILPAKPTGDEAALPRTPGHPLPPRPHVSQSSAPLPQVQATSFDASASVAVLELSESALSVMEQQRKQELLARKAVQASRKRKEPASPASTLPSTSPARSAKTEVSMRHSASAVSVDDFLNSLGPTLPKDTPESALNFDVGNAFPTPRVDSPEPMNVDDEIPGFGGHLYSEYNPLPRPSVDALSGPSPPGAMSMPESFDELRPTEGNRTEAALPPRESPQAADEAPSRASSEGTPAPQPMGDGERDVRRSSDTPQPTAPVPRRGTKRPVASDFDSEPVSKTFTPPVVSRTGSGFGFSTYASTFHPNPHVRRKMNAAAAAGGFAGLIVQRRCVIDVSDSEEESSDDEAPPTTPAPSTPSDPSPRDSALALEQEIERMRRLIREREELQLRKQVMSSGRSTPASRTAPAASATSEQPSERAASSSTSESEISRSATERDTLPKNVLANVTVATSPRVDADANSTPSPPALTPLSLEDSSKVQAAVSAPTDQAAVTHTATIEPVGDPGLTAESRPESAASSRASTPPLPPEPAPLLAEDGPDAENVDVATSAQVRNSAQVKQGSSFAVYDSVLSPYPFLSGHSLAMQELADSSDNMPELRRLKIQVALRQMTAKGLENARICQFEVPGGGICRDAGCGDIHLSRLEVEPNDAEAAHYLSGGNNDRNVAQMLAALQAARARRPEATFDERAQEAWTTMQVR